MHILRPGPGRLWAIGDGGCDESDLVCSYGEMGAASAVQADDGDLGRCHRAEFADCGGRMAVGLARLADGQWQSQTAPALTSGKVMGHRAMKTVHRATNG